MASIWGSSGASACSARAWATSFAATAAARSGFAASTWACRSSRLRSLKLRHHVSLAERSTPPAGSSLNFAGKEIDGAAYRGAKSHPPSAIAIDTAPNRRSVIRGGLAPSALSCPQLLDAWRRCRREVLLVALSALLLRRPRAGLPHSPRSSPGDWRQHAHSRPNLP